MVAEHDLRVPHVVREIGRQFDGGENTWRKGDGHADGALNLGVHVGHLEWLLGGKVVLVGRLGEGSES
jgi:hypothetical protein